MTGFESKREAAADKLLEEATRSCNNIDEQRALDALMREAQPAQEPVCDKDPQGCWNVRCQLGKQCKNLAQPPSEWAGIKAILDEYGLQAIDFVADFKAVLAQPAQEQNFCSRCGKRTADKTAIHTCTPPQEGK